MADLKYPRLDFVDNDIPVGGTGKEGGTTVSQHPLGSTEGMKMPTTIRYLKEDIFIMRRLLRSRLQQISNTIRENPNANANFQRIPLQVATGWEQRSPNEARAPDGAAASEASDLVVAEGRLAAVVVAAGLVDDVEAGQEVHGPCTLAHQNDVERCIAFVAVAGLPLREELDFPAVAGDREFVAANRVADADLFAGGEVLHHEIVAV